MNFIYFALLGYLLLAIEAAASKYLLAGRVINWRLYLFYVSVLSLFGLVFAPWGLHWWGWKNFWWAFSSGVVFFFSLGFLFFSLTSSAASRVYVLFGAFSTLVGLVLMKLFFEENLNRQELFSVLLLLTGGFFISFKFTERRFFHNYKKIVLAGFLAGVSLVLLKDSYDRVNFVSGYIFSRLGIFFPALFFLIVPVLRKKTFSVRAGRRKIVQSPLWKVILVKTLAGAGTVLISYSISIGSLTIVNALVAVQYLITFFLAIWLAAFFREFSKEKIPTVDIIFKFIGVFLVVLGVFGVNFS